MSARTYDFVAIGAGPFNLGLAALADPVADLDGVVLEGRAAFDWHPGMLLPDSTLQVPFLADLVSMADPTSRWSFLNYLKEQGRLYPFYIRESFYPLRTEYRDYCRWVSERLGSVHFDQLVTRVEHDGEAYVVRTEAGDTWRGRRLVLGTGTSPRWPDAASDVADDPYVVHTADYLRARDRLQGRDSITVLGSGQSAAEVYRDLLAGTRADGGGNGYRVDWVTRSPRFFPMEYTKLTLELTSPEYTSYYQRLPEQTRDRLGREQRTLYKGISGDLVDELFDTLYQREVHGGTDTTLVTNTSLTGVEREASGSYLLRLHHDELDRSFTLRTDAVVLATGYEARVPAFLDPVRDRIRWDDEGRYLAGPTYAVDHDQDEVFVQNGEEHTHGFVAPDLGMGAYRSSVIIAAMTGREVYPIEKRIAFQEFGIPERALERG